MTNKKSKKYLGLNNTTDKKVAVWIIAMAAFWRDIQFFFRAASQDRTGDPHFTKVVLCQLS